MSGKRKYLEFDPNKSDSNDEDFDPSEAAPRRSAKKSRSSRGHSHGTSGHRKKRRGGYRGSDIDDDVNELLDDSDFGGSFIDDSDDEDAPKNAAGRRARKAATTAQTYAESSEDEEDEEEDDESDQDSLAGDDVDEQPTPRTSRVVKLKVSSAALAATMPRRTTRAMTEDEEDFVELSNSGHHAIPSRDSNSRSPPPTARRSSRAAKGTTETIEEATQESSAPQFAADSDEDELDALVSNTKKEAELKDEEMFEDVDEDIKDEVADLADDDDEDEDDDIVPARRGRGRPRRADAAAEDAEEVEEAPEEPEATGKSRRLTRNKSKKAEENADDWEPDADADDESAKDDDELDDPDSPSHGRRSKTRSRAGGDSGDDDDMDLEELNEEARELRKSSRRRRVEEEVAYESSSRRSRPKVNYYMPPLTSANIEEDEADDVAAPSRSRRRGGANTVWERNLNTTFGPFGGASGAGSLLSGPWGTGAAGGAADSDSSDDEMAHRPSVVGNVGMTPTSAATGGLLPGLGPINMEGAGAPNVGKIKDRKALADADPLGVDMNVDFSKVGGLEGHIDQLKEMVQLPLLYPELFTRFHVTPPRGVLFHGPPGTGKTLLARALANSVGQGGKKISFYMRKGADALSKWVGEAEKQLRLLFEEARRTQPSIIFFDEIDGLAPVRSSKQEQIHASIVSTLLALMDGMDGRGQVIVIGATNRPDNIDPALRRPGRFDREFYFPLPDIKGREAIINIHTKDWGLGDDFKRSLAQQTKGYGGADLRALCTEASLNAIQRTYPQIYSSTEKLLVDPSKINVHASDFMISIKKLVPSSERSTSAGARPLPDSIAPLLGTQFTHLRDGLRAILPTTKKVTALEEAMYEQHNDSDHGFARESMAQEFERSRIYRPRYLVYAPPGMGHGYITSALLHDLEGVHVQRFDLPTLLGDGRPMEQVIVGLFSEVRRHKPSIILIPNIDDWYATLAGSIALITFKTMLKSIAPTDPVLLLGTAECNEEELRASDMWRDFFSASSKSRAAIAAPSAADREKYFRATLALVKKRPEEFPDPTNRRKRKLEELPLAPRAAPKPPSKAEIKQQKKQDHQWLNALKVQLQPIMDQINRKYKKFRQPVIPYAQIEYLFIESDPHYVRPDLPVEGQIRPFEIIKDKHDKDVLRDTITGKTFFNLDTSTIEERLSNGFYCRPKDFLFDIKALAKDAKNIGDKERTLKANELLSNVEVDIATIEANSAAVDWEALHQRQVDRAKYAAEKERKRAAMQSVLDRVQSDAATGNDSETQGPVTLGVTVPSATGNFLPTTEQAAVGPTTSQLSNGAVSIVNNEADVTMSGMDDTTQLVSPMAPPPKSQDPFGQVSQHSAVTSLPPGVSPSAVINDAATTKTTDPSEKRSSNFSTQLTNGHRSSGADSQMPSTLNASASTHGQQAAGQDPSAASAPASSQQSYVSPKSRPLDSQETGSQAVLEVPDSAIESQLAHIVKATSQCTIEQMEHLNRELMDTIWQTRGEWNRRKALDLVIDSSNITIADIDAVQRDWSPSQRSGAGVSAMHSIEMGSGRSPP